jgi:hypothetical protein
MQRSSRCTSATRLPIGKQSVLPPVECVDAYVASRHEPGPTGMAGDVKHVNMRGLRNPLINPATPPRVQSSDLTSVEPSFITIPYGVWIGVGVQMLALLSVSFQQGSLNHMHKEVYTTAAVCTACCLRTHDTVACADSV